MLARALLLLLLSSVVASAQDRWAPPDKDLWEAMSRALHDLPMSLASHHGIEQILQQTQTEAQNRALRAKLPERMSNDK